MDIWTPHTRCIVGPLQETDGIKYVDVTVTLRVDFNLDDDLKQSSVMQFVAENLPIEI